MDGAGSVQVDLRFSAAVPHFLSASILRWSALWSSAVLVSRPCSGLPA